MEEGEEVKVVIEDPKVDSLQARAYSSMAKVRVTFRTEGVGIANASKYQFIFEASQKLIEFKVKMTQITKQPLYFYLNQSFMPSLDSPLGDLGQCYGRYDDKNNYYDIQFIVNGNQNRYG